MADGQYAKCVQPLRLGTESINPSFRGKISDFALIHDQKTTPDSPIRTETYYAYAPGTGAFAPSKLLPILDGRPAEELRNVGSHAHNDFDEVYYFIGTDCTDNTRLGGQVEMWLGHGEDAEKFVMKDPTAVFVPKGVAHNPWIVTKVTDPDHPIMITCVSLTNKYSLAADAVTNYPYPPAFNPDLIGVPQPGKGTHAKYVNRLTLSQDIYISLLIGRVCTPNLMFDSKVFRGAALDGVLLRLCRRDRGRSAHARGHSQERRHGVLGLDQGHAAPSELRRSVPVPTHASARHP